MTRLMGIVGTALLAACATSAVSVVPAQEVARRPALQAQGELRADAVGEAMILPAGVYRLGDPGIVNPVIVQAPGPTYTAEALLNKVNGHVLLHGIIGANGAVIDIRILKPLEDSLDDAARSAFSRWRFRPATLDGVPVPVAITVKMAFATR